MTEDLPLQEEAVPASEPLATSGIPESDKKRVMIGSAIGGGIFLGVLVAIIVLVSTEKKSPNPNPVPKPEYFPHFNPYVVLDFVRESTSYAKVTLNNTRKDLEKDIYYYSDSFGYVPIVRDTYENREPEYLVVHVIDYDEHMTRLLYEDPMERRWHVPYFANHSDPYSQASMYTHQPSSFEIIPDPTNMFQWHYHSRTLEFAPVIDTLGCRLQYFDKYLEFEALLERDHIYGMGERIESFHLKNDNYSLWNRYLPSDHRSDTEYGMFGSHPFILNKLTNIVRQDFIGIFMRNSNAMLFSMWDHSSNGTTINYKMIGGVIDLFLFHTAEPQYIIRKYHSVIGRPYLPPIWGMGLQQARDGYTVKDLERVMNGYQNAYIPVDALWADNTMNDNYKTFTVNSDSFNGIKDFVKKMHDPVQGHDMHFVAIANPYLKKDQSYKYYTEALAKHALILSPVIPTWDQPYEGRTAAGTSVWLDFFLHDATLIWSTGLHEFHDLTLYDGVWISENEPYNLCNGYCSTSVTDADGEPGIPNPTHNLSEFNYLLYRPTIDPLDADTLPMTAFHADDAMFHKQFYTHNLYSVQIVRATFDALYGIIEDKRALIASRASWPGSGHFSSHWLDSNYATWESMRSSIASVLNFNMFGIPHVGAPIGGYYFNATDELMIRWYSLGAFYPLMLTYTTANVNPKEAFALEKNSVELVRKVLIERYSLIRFMYTKMFEAYLWGGSVIHPLFFDFFNETEVYKRDVLDTCFMWGSTLYVIPSLVPHQETISGYLPNWRWYELRTLSMVAEYSPFMEHGHYYEFDQPLGYITVLIKGGSIIPYQHLSDEAKIMNTKDLETIPAQIIVAPDHTGKAIGSMLVDSEGIRPYPDPNSNTYRHYTFTYMNQIFRINKLAGFDFPGSYVFDEFWELLILDNFGKNQVDFVCMMDVHMRKKELLFEKGVSSNMLKIHDYSSRRLLMPTMESIVWGANENHDFCKFQAHMNTFSLSDRGRVMSGTLVTSDPQSYQLKFDFKATALTDRIVHFEIAKNEPGVTEWRVPDIVSEEFKRTPKTERTLDAVGFGTSRLNEDFFFEMSEEDDPHDFLLTSRNQPFVYVRNFIQVKFLVDGKHIFGLGERVSKFELADGIYSIWNYDTMREETGQLPGNNMYGFHPFYMFHTHNPYDFAGVFFLTSNPMDVRVKHIGVQTEMDHILSGGIIEIFFMAQASADQIVKDYHYIIGKPVPLPFWAFGYHQSRWGYKDIEHLKQVVRRFDEESIPLDGMWMDKDFMSKFRSFTIDTRNWYGLKEFVNELHKEGRHFVAIVDAGIARDTEYSVYQKGQAANVFIKSSFTNTELIGITWAGYSVWVDFLNSASTHFWQGILQEFYSLVEFDALWLDMNEPSNFCDGECPDQLHYHYYFFPLDYYDDLYYNPTHRPLEKSTISMEAIHAGDAKSANEFNYHSMYGYFQSKATSDFFTNKLNKRPFIISSSTFPGSGRYVAHWLGDNYSTWTDMQNSIAGMIHFGMYGIPFVGANICGYSGNATERLCARWMQLGAYYPFMRNHNNPSGSPQEPYMSEIVKTASKYAIRTRYSLVRYIYTEYMHTVLRGGTMMKALPFLFPEDEETYTTVDISFMLGSALRITPIMHDTEENVQTYFPNADWYTFSSPNYEKVVDFNSTGRKGKNVTVHSGISGDTSNVQIRGGTIFPFQNVQEGIKSVLQVHNLPMNLMVAPDTYQKAHGEIFYDTEHHTNFNTEHQDIEMDMLGAQINFHMFSGKELTAYNQTDMFIEKIIILGAAAYEKAAVARYETNAGGTVNMKAPVYDRAKKILTLEAVDAKSMNILKLKRVFWADQ